MGWPTKRPRRSRFGIRATTTLSRPPSHPNPVDPAQSAAPGLPRYDDAGSHAPACPPGKPELDDPAGSRAYVSPAGDKGARSMAGGREDETRAVNGLGDVAAVCDQQ